MVDELNVFFSRFPFVFLGKMSFLSDALKAQLMKV
jgi:hypothetical protein